MKKTVWMCMNKKCIQQTLPCLKSCSGQEPDYDCLLKPAGQLALIPKWKETTKYQITEVPEPVYYLDIPEELKLSVEGFLFRHNGIEVRIIKESTPGSFLIQFAGANRTVLKSWIKQKPAEPTREELQERINTVRGYITRNPDSIGSIAYEELTEILGKKEKRP